MSKRRELIERRREQQRRQTLIIMIAIGVVAVVLIGGAVVLSNAQNQANSNLLSMKADTRPVPPNAQPNARAWGPADAPIKIEEYLDYQCPACGSYNRSYEQGVI